MTGEFELMSLSRVCTTLQITPANVRELATLAKVRPSLRLDDVPFFNAADFERMKKSLAAKQRPATAKDAK
jgi:hypothetical protein